MKFEIGDKVRLRESFPFPQFAGKIVTITGIESETQLRARWWEQNMVIYLSEIEPIVKFEAKPVKQIPPIPTNCDVMKAAIEHYGIHYQMVKATEELSELAKEVCKYQIGKGDKDHITEEMADVAIIFRELKMMLDISNYDLFKWADKKFHRLWEEINKEG